MTAKKSRRPLKHRMLLVALAMCLIMCAAFLTVDALNDHNQMEEAMGQKGDEISGLVQSRLTASVLDWYSTSMDADAEYAEYADHLQQFVDCDLAADLYVLGRQGDRFTYLFSAQPKYDYASALTEDRSLGAEPKLDEKLLERVQKVFAGEHTRPRAVKDPVLGWQLIGLEPVVHGDGRVVGCIVVVFSLNGMKEVQTRMLWQTVALLAAVVLILLAGYMFFVGKTIVDPIQQLIDAVKAYEVGENKASLRSLEIKGNDELRTLADSFRMMLVEIDLRGYEERELAVREERIEAELKLTNAVNSAMIPKELPQGPEETGVDICGLSEKIGELSCDFYDYFMLEDGKLCFVVGSVPSRGVSAALYMVIAKTAIKSQMRGGMPLLEAIAEANRQLYEVGRGMVADALVGVLDGKGLLSYVNAGMELPLLMRREDRFEWQKGPVYAPLGQNENVSYQVQQIQLFQGDRMFFHTAGLAGIVGTEGQLFATQRLQAALNLSRGKQLKAEQLVSYMNDEGKAYAARTRDIPGYSLLALDYLRSRKDLAHCVADRDRAGAEKVTGFLKKQLHENGFDRREIAQAVVVAEEVFAICCRQRSQGLITVECAVDEQMQIGLRFKSTFGGKDPLVVPGGGDVENALAFIRRSGWNTSFHPGQPRDTLTVVRAGDSAAL